MVDSFFGETAPGVYVGVLVVARAVARMLVGLRVALPRSQGLPVVHSVRRCMHLPFVACFAFAIA